MAEVVKSPGGSIVLSVLAVGLVLYAGWRLLSTLLIRGNSLKAWGDRAGYMFSAAFYSVIALTAITAVIHGDSPEDSNTIERLSRGLLESPVGRWLLFVAGAVAAGIGGYFVVRKGFGRSFLDELDLGGAGDAERAAITTTGTVGWIGRGIITTAVGWYVLSAAWQADASDARGFDRAFRELASSRTGAFTAGAAGVALVVYGAFCWLSIRRLELDPDA